MRGTIILWTIRFYLRKTYYFCSVKLRHHLGVDAANRWWGTTKSAINETDNKQQQEHNKQERKPEAGHEKQES